MKRVLSSLILLVSIFLFYTSDVYGAITITATVDGQCGNSIVEPNEQCDMSSLAGKTCSDFSYASGTLACSPLCAFDLTQCTDYAPYATSSTSTPQLFISGGMSGGGNVIIPLPPQTSSVYFKGVTGLNSRIQLMQNEVVVAESTANFDGTFQVSISGIVSGSHTFQVRSVNQYGVVTRSQNFHFIITNRSVTTVDGINLNVISSSVTTPTVESPFVQKPNAQNPNIPNTIPSVGINSQTDNSKNFLELSVLFRSGRINVDDIANGIVSTIFKKIEGDRSLETYLTSDTEMSSLGLSQTFKVQLRVDPKDEVFHTIESAISYPANSIRLVRIEDGDSIISSWFTRPNNAISNNALGRVSLLGSVYGGFSGYIRPTSNNAVDGGRVVTLVFETVSPGVGKITASSTVYALGSTGPSSQKANQEIYFNIKSYQHAVEDISQDKNPPEIHVLELYKGDTTFDGQSYVVFQARDDVSGVEYFEVFRDGVWASTTSPYKLEGNLPSVLKIKAVDRTGKSSVRDIQIDAGGGIFGMLNNPVVYIPLFLLLLVLCIRYLIRFLK